MKITRKINYLRVKAIPLFTIGLLMIIIAEIIANVELYLIIPAIFLFIGSLMNALVIVFNGYRMPIFTGQLKKKVMGNNIHYATSNDKKIKLFYLCDRFIFTYKVKNKQSILIFSIGDFYIMIGFLLSLFSALVIYQTNG